MNHFSKNTLHKHHTRTIKARDMGKIFLVRTARYNNIHFPSCAFLNLGNSHRLLFFKSSVNSVDCFMTELLLHTKTLIIRKVDK